MTPFVTRDMFDSIDRSDIYSPLKCQIIFRDFLSDFKFRDKICGVLHDTNIVVFVVKSQSEFLETLVVNFFWLNMSQIEHSCQEYSHFLILTTDP